MHISIHIGIAGKPGDKGQKGNSVKGPKGKEFFRYFFVIYIHSKHAICIKRLDYNRLILIFIGSKGNIGKSGTMKKGDIGQKGERGDCKNEKNTKCFTDLKFVLQEVWAAKDLRV